MIDRLSPYAYALLRIVAGALFMCHGLQKLGLLGGHAVALHSRYGLAMVIELLCGPLIAVGLFTRVAAFIASGEMAGALLTAHLPRGWVPIQNGGEPAVLYCFLFLFVCTRGAVKFGIDK